MDADIDSDSSSDMFLSALQASREAAKRMKADQSKVGLLYVS